jgi:TonB family protein
MCINNKGVVTESSVDEPSKYPRLDQAGLDMAKRYRFKPGTEDGKVRERDCFVQPITFSLKEE